MLGEFQLTGKVQQVTKETSGIDQATTVLSGWTGTLTSNYPKGVAIPDGDDVDYIDVRTISLLSDGSITEDGVNAGISLTAMDPDVFATPLQWTLKPGVVTLISGQTLKPKTWTFNALLAGEDATLGGLTPVAGMPLTPVVGDVPWDNVTGKPDLVTTADIHAATSKTPPVDADEIPLIDSAASFGLKKLTWANLKAATDSRYQGTADYVISVSGSTYTATPRPTSTLTAYSGTNFTTVLQNAVTALTTGAVGAGSSGSGGGKIHICDGVYTFGNAVTITGWEGISGASASPMSQLVIEGEGHATQLVQNTSGQNMFVLKNCACIYLKDLGITIGASASSAIFGDKTGSTSEMSCSKSKIDNLTILSNSTSAAAVYLKNFFDLDVPKLWVYSSANHGIVLENDSTATNYGNSKFGFVRSRGSSSASFAGLAIRSTNTTKYMDMMEFSNFESNGSYYGIYALGANWCTFNLVDLEGAQVCLFLDSGTLGNAETKYFTVNSGYLLPASGGTGIESNVNSGSHNIHCYIETNGSSVPVNDLMQFLPGNLYDIDLPDTAAAGRISLAAPQQHRLRINTGNSYSDFFPAGTTTVTPSNGDNSVGLATTAFVTSALPYLTHAATAKTTPVGADELLLLDSGASYGQKKTTAANLLAGVATGIPFWAANYHRLNIEDPTATTVLVANQADGNTFIAGRSTTLTQLGVYVTSGGSSGAVIRFGLFLLNGTTATLVTDFGTAAAITSSAFVSVVGTAAIVAGARYIAVAVSQGSPATPPTVHATSALEQWGTQVGYTGSALLTQGIGARVGGGGAYSGALSSGSVQASGSSPAIVGFCAT